MSMDFDVREQMWIGFSLEEALLWIIDWYFNQKCRFKVFSLDSHSDGTHSLKKMHDEQVMQKFSKSFLMNKQTHGWPEVKLIFHKFSEMKIVGELFLVHRYFQ